jgi:serine/threonine-protein kinase
LNWNMERDGSMPACTYPAGASPFGALNMAGNVWEWTADRSGGYATGAQTNPTGPASGAERVNRGGSWGCTDVGELRAASRYGVEPAFRNYALGFRCARGH